MKIMGRLDNKIAVVTGGGRGIGAATAQLFAAEGARVVVASRSQDELESVCAGSQGRIAGVVTDVAQESEVSRLFEETKRRFGLIDILVNNAGILRLAPLQDMTAQDWDAVLSVNLRGSFLCAREAFRQMRQAGRGGSVINISSLAGIRGVEKFRGTSAYAASKHGLIGLTEVMAVEGRPLGIRVNAIAPGAVDTKMLREGDTTLKTSTKPEDIAKTVLYLADDNASPKVTGAVMEIHCNE